jgi:carbon monoxide dehydrogenase subunit G
MTTRDARLGPRTTHVISFETSVRIGRPIEEVFGFVSDPTRFPLWNSAVQAVHRTSGETGEPGSTYMMERELPTGRVENRLEVFAREYPSEFGIRTTSGPTPFTYRYRFAPDGSDTVVHLDATVNLPGVAAALGPLAARRVRRGVDANFASLKRTLERGAADASIRPR